MADSLSLGFVSNDEPFSEVRIHRIEYSDELNGAFSLVVELGSSDPAVDPRSVVGQDVVLQLEGEPFLREVRGLVQRMRQRTSVVTSGGGTSLYELTIVPPLWLLSCASGRRIHQERTSLEMLAATLGAHGGRVPPAVERVGRIPNVREYFSQYDETDLELVQRLLTEEGCELTLPDLESRGQTVSYFRKPATAASRCTWSPSLMTYARISTQG